MDEFQLGPWQNSYLDLVFEIWSNIVINLDRINFLDNFGGDLIKGQTVPYVKIMNSNFKSNTDYGENLNAWKFEDFSHMFSTWAPPDFSTDFGYDAGCKTYLWFNYIYGIEIRDTVIENNY